MQDSDNWKIKGQPLKLPSGRVSNLKSLSHNIGASPTASQESASHSPAKCKTKGRFASLVVPTNGEIFVREQSQMLSRSPSYKSFLKVSMARDQKLLEQQVKLAKHNARMLEKRR